MAAAFKHLIHAGTVREAAHHLRRACPDGFDAARFEALAVHGLEGLEMKARAMHIADALEATLPAGFAQAAAAIEAALGPPVPVEAPASAPPDVQAGLAGWIVWPLGEYVARRGQAQPQRALQALHALTQRFSAEFAIRPFLLRQPQAVYPLLQQWLHDDSAHVRRLVSEGTRPRLPWGLQLKPLIADPSPNLPLLRALQDDPSPYVRRSVANHLNDIARDHPAQLAGWLAEHLPGADAPRRALLRHASRTLIKRGDAAVLAAWGLGRPLRGEATLALAPRRLAVGDALELAVTLRSTARTAQRLEVDYAVHHVKADGRRTPKVFKGWSLELAGGEQRELRKRHSMKPVTTRRYFPGEHLVELRVNGRPLAQAAFVLGG